MYHASFKPSIATKFDVTRPIELLSVSATGHRIRLSVEEAETLANEIRLAVCEAKSEAVRSAS
jgi:hypothetical protein